MVTQLLESWSSIYSNHAALRTAVEFTHIGGLVAGGGGAITADLATITAARQNGSPVRASQLELLKRTHRIVLAGLVALSRAACCSLPRISRPISTRGSSGSRWG